MATALQARTQDPHVGLVGSPDRSILAVHALWRHERKLLSEHHRFVEVNGNESGPSIPPLIYRRHGANRWARVHPWFRGS